MANIYNIIRLLSFPIGILTGFYRLGKTGSRDIINLLKFRDSNIELGVCIDCKSVVYPQVCIMKNSIVNNSVIASYTYIGKNCLIQNTTIGKFCSIANDVAIGLGEHPTDKFSTSPLFYRKNNPIKIQLLEKDLGFNEYESIAIGNDVWVGTRALIMNGVKIGTGAIIAANAVVTHDVPPYAVVGGSPARIIKYRFDDSEIANLMNMKWWEMELGDIKERLVRYD